MIAYIVDSKPSINIPPIIIMASMYSKSLEIVMCLNLSCNRTAKSSLPPVVVLAFSTSPRPAPVNIPPKTVARKMSLSTNTKSSVKPRNRE